MGVKAGPRIVKDGLIFDLDAAVSRSYSGTGLIANGLVGNINGSLVNGVGFTSSNNGYFVFDGTNDYIDVADFNFDFSNGFTICAFCYPTAVNNWGRIIDFGLGQANDNIIFSRYGSGNNFFLEVRSGTAPQQSLVASSGNQFVINTFHFLAGVVDAGSPGSVTTARLFHNGNQISSSPVGNIVVPNTVNRTLNYIGRSNWVADSYYQGNVGQTQLYNRALTQQEILQNYNATKGRYGL
jgi:hypothetical protein